MLGMVDGQNGGARSRTWTCFCVAFSAPLDMAWLVSRQLPPLHQMELQAADIVYSLFWSCFLFKPNGNYNVNLIK